MSVRLTTSGKVDHSLSDWAKYLRDCDHPTRAQDQRFREGDARSFDPSFITRAPKRSEGVEIPSLPHLLIILI